MLLFVTFAKVIKPFNRKAYDNNKKSLEELRENKLLNRVCREVPDFGKQLARFERNISVLGRSRKTYENYARQVAAMALHFGCLPTKVDLEEVQDYLYLLQKRHDTPSLSYFKHTVYGLHFLLKSEGLPYEYLHLPAISKEKKISVILSKEEVWRILTQSCYQKPSQKISR